MKKHQYRGDATIAGQPVSLYFYAEDSTLARDHFAHCIQSTFGLPSSTTRVRRESFPPEKGGVWFPPEPTSEGTPAGTPASSTT